MKIDLTNCNVVITGGSEGIGNQLARRFIAEGCRVLITGRSKTRLAKAAQATPGLEVLVNDISSSEAREKLAHYIAEHMPKINILINNAGFQRRISLAEDNAPWNERQNEIDTLLSGPIHLSDLILPLMLKHGQQALIANVTSGGAYIPQPFAPVYSACKAALHSYTVNLRHALSQTRCRVVEIIPPAVKTSLAGPGLTHGVPLDEFTDAVFDALVHNESDEIGFGMTATSEFNDAKKTYEKMFAAFSSRFDVKIY